MVDAAISHVSWGAAVTASPSIIASAALDDHANALDDHANALALAVLVAKRTNPRERDEEDLWPDGSGYVDDLERAEQLTKLKQQAMERGMDPAKLETLADELGQELASYLEEWLEAPTPRGRRRRSGLLPTLDE